MRTITVLLVLLFCGINPLYSQTKFKYGKLTPEEKAYTTYKKDSTVNAVVLYEKGDNYFKIIDNRLKIVKEYHVKIKILNEKGFEHGKISIPYYHNESSSEKVTEIKAKTHNGSTSYSVMPDQFFVNDVSERWSEKTFTFPKLQKGSVIEYYYKLTTPFYFNFKGWEFQSSIPKIYSEFNATIPGYYHYNRNLNGPLKLSSNEAEVKRNCFKIPGSANEADCEVLKYAMKGIPPFKKEEAYMLAASNYISRIDFELSELTRFDGSRQKFTKSWKDVDREFKTDKNIGKQLSKRNFFQKSVPENLLIEGNELERAKNIYDFVRNHYTWNKKFGIFRKARVKQAFDAKIGSVAEINMSLINLLNAADIKTQLMLSSSRQHGLPKTSHPVMTDFNYILVYITIGEENYLLDATDKFIPFGMLPYRALNHYGRVMDFKEESYWTKIAPHPKNRYQIRGLVKLNTVEENAEGVFDFIKLGYNAVNLRKEISNSSEEEYYNELQDTLGDEYVISSYELNEEKSNEQRVNQRIIFDWDNALDADMVYLNPFFISFFKQNPFTLDERNYPIDFGYPRNYKYQMSIEIPEGYSVHQMPENKLVKLGENNGYLKLTMNQNSNIISVAYDFNLKEVFFKADNYDALKEIFKQSIEIQKNSLVVLKKE